MSKNKTLKETLQKSINYYDKFNIQINLQKSIQSFKRHTPIQRDINE